MDLAAAGWLIAVIGCGDGTGGVSVNGSVSYLDKPLANGAIYFFPAKGPPSIAALDDNGAYSIDLPPGDYRVIVNKSDPVPSGWKEGDPPPPATITLPSEYSEPAKTVLKATVAENQDDPISFALE